MGSEIFATGQRESKISRKIQLVIAPGKKGSVTGNERETVFTGRGRMSGELIQRVIVVSGKNRKPLMILCIPAALEIHYVSIRYE